MSEDSNRHNMTEELWKVVNSLRGFTIVITAVVVTIGILVLFIASIFCDKASIDDMNSFVGIVLGIVATCCSILSIYLSFYSLEKSEESGQEQLQLISEILHKQADLKEAITYRSTPSNEVIAKPEAGKWESIPEERKNN